MLLSGTILRFGTLVVLALVITAWIFAYLATVLPDPQRDAVDVCEQRTGYQLLPSATGVTGSTGAAFTACLSGTYRAMVLSLVGGLLLLAVVTAVWYAAQPRWRMRRRRLVRVDALPESAALRADLAALVGRAGLRTAPVFLVDATARRAGGLAFGGWRLRAVCLDAGLVAVRGRDPERFRTVVLHELAHLRNRDVSTTYLTVALWRAFLLVAALPFAVLVVQPWLVDIITGHPSIWTGGLLALRDLPVFAAPTVPIVVMTLGALIARDAVLRSRELHADARTARWIGSQDPARVLPGLGSGRFAGRWRTHPRPAQRRRAVTERWLLLRPGFWECVAVVLALQLTGTYLEYAAAEFIGQTGAGVAVARIHTEAQAVLIGLLLMLSCWRAAGVRRGFVRPAAGVVVGLASWMVLDPLSQLSTGQRTLISWPTIGSAVALLVVAALVAGLTGLLGWCAIRLRASGASARRVLVAGAAGLVVCWAALRWWNVLVVSGGFRGFGLMNAATRDLLHGYAPGGAVLLVVLLAPLLTVQLACAYAVAGVLIPVVALVAWVPAALASARSMTGALRAGAVVGVAGVALLVAERVGLVFLVPPAIRHTDGFAVVTAAWAVVVVLLGQVLAAFVRGWRARDPWWAALAASSVAAAIGLAALWVLSRVAPWPGGTFDPLPFLAIYLVGSVGVALSVLAIAAGRIPASRPAVAQRARFAAAGSAAVLGAALVLLVFLTPSPSRQIVLVRTDPVAVPRAPTEREAIGVWLAAGGSREFTQLTETVEDLVALEQRTPVPVADIVAACRSGLPVFQAAMSYPPPPGAPARDWHTLLTTGTADLDQCVTTNGATIGHLLITSLAPVTLAVGHDLLNVH